MKTRSLLIILSIVMLMPNVMNAQFGALRRALDKQIDHKIDSSVDKNAQDERDKKAKEESEQNKGENSEAKDKSEPKRGFFGGKIDIKYKDQYDFTGRIYMQVENYDKKDVTKSDFYIYFDPSNLDAGIEMQTLDPKDKKTVISTAFLFDNENRAFMSLLGNNFGTISSMPSDSAIAAQAKARGEESNPPVVTKTGNSRMIAGYKCDEYKVVSSEKDGYSLVWMTKDLKMKADKRYWGQTGMPTYYNYPGFEGAVMLAMEKYDKNNELRLKMETKEINENFKHSISTVGYTFSKMNFGQGRGGKK